MLDFSDNSNSSAVFYWFCMMHGTGCIRQTTLRQVRRTHVYSVAHVLNFQRYNSKKINYNELAGVLL